MKPEWGILIFLATCMLTTTGLVLVSHQETYTDKVAQTTMEHQDMTYASHYVKIHIVPEEENVAVAAWASDSFPPTTGYTDKNSDVVFELISTAEYNIWIPERKFSIYIYPSESEYVINTDRRLK